MQNKRGAELTIGTIIIIILALVVLVFLIYGFTVGWNNLFGQITNVGGDSNVQSVVRGCDIACTTNAQYDWCSQKREVVFGEGDERNGEEFTCDQLSVMGVGLDGCDAIPDCSDFAGDDAGNDADSDLVGPTP